MVIHYFAIIYQNRQIKTYKKKIIEKKILPIAVVVVVVAVDGNDDDVAYARAF